MKIIIGSVLLLLMTSQSYAFSLTDFEGKYIVSNKYLRVQSTFTIDKEGNIELVESRGYFNCKGTSELELESEVVRVELNCNNTNNQTLEMVINLTKVENLNSFTAPIYSKVTGNLPWKFVRIAQP
jgi:hypothetical protein